VLAASIRYCVCGVLKLPPLIIVPKLVDTKSVNNTTLLHFLERTVHKYFPDMEEFLDELSKPAEAYRGQSLSLI
jgi:hypothetical protein